MSKEQEVEQGKKEKLTLAQARIVGDKERFLEVLAENMGILTLSASKIGKNRRTIERWRQADPEFNDAVCEQLRLQKDFVVGKFMQNITAGDTRAMIFYLRCKGNDGLNVPEGWQEKFTIQGNKEAPIEVHANVEVKETREEVSDSALIKALGKAMKAMPEVFKEDDKKEGDK